MSDKNILRIFSMMLENNQKVAIIHDWLVSMRGGEKVLEVLCELFPNAQLYTLVYCRDKISATIKAMKVNTSFIQHLPYATTRYQYYLPLYPTAIEQFNLKGYDVIISSSHAVAKGVKVPKGALHICYCHTPMRYIWDQYEDYFGKGRSSLLTRIVMKLFLNYLRKWDQYSSKGVTYFIANSRNVQDRIKRIYNRDSEVIYPPVDVERFSVSLNDEGYFLVVSALVPYKRIDIAVEAFNRLQEKLIIVGNGKEESKLKSQAKKNIIFRGWVNDDELVRLYSRCRALIFPGEEDFGIVPVEAMACGKPVIAYGKGGATETVIDGETGILFKEQNVECLIESVNKFKIMKFDGTVIRDQALRFDRKLFKKEIKKFLIEKFEEHKQT